MLTQREPLIFGADVRLWRSDIFGTRREPIEPVTPLSGEVEYNEDRTYKRRFALDVVNPDAVRDLTDFVTGELRLTSPQGASIVLPLGHYVLFQPDATYEPGLATGSIEGFDLTYLLDRMTMPSRYVVPAGTDTSAAARAVSTGGGVPQALVNIPDSGIVFASDRPFAPGTSRLGIANDCLAAGGMYHAWATGHNVLTSMRYIDLAQVAPVSTLSTEGEPGEVLIVSPIQRRRDAQRLRNRVTVERAVPGSESLSYTATVTDPTSPLHPDRLAEAMGATDPVILADPEPTQDINAETIDVLQANAERLLAERASYQEVITLDTIVDPTADAHQVVRVNALDGRKRLYDGLWWRRTWRIRLDGVTAIMTHELNRNVRQQA